MSYDSEEEDDTINISSTFKKYTIQKCNIFLQQPIQENPETSYGRLEDAKNIDLVEPNEEPRPIWIVIDLFEPNEEPQTIWIVIDLSHDEEELLISTLKE